MNRDEILTSFQNRGLRAWQANFAASFLASDAHAFHLLTAPPGTGKMYASVAIAVELAKRQALRMLVLAPASLCEQWNASLREVQSTTPVLLVSRRLFREMEAALPIGQSLWKPHGIYVISLDVAKQDDFAHSLSTLKWDLVIVDEAHHLAGPQRAALFDRLWAKNAIRRLLLLSATPLPALHQWINPLLDQPARFPPLVVTSWYGELKNSDGSILEKAPVLWAFFSYKRSADEVKLLSLFHRRKHELETVSSGNKFVMQILTQRASSSLFAFEQSLQRLKRSLRVQGLEVFLDKDSADQSELLSDFEEATALRDQSSVSSDKTAELAVIDECLESLELISVDEKLNGLKNLIRSILGAVVDVPRICVFSMYSDTISYLHTALEDIGLPLFKVTGASPYAERETVIRQFLHEGGVILGTDAVLSAGQAMVQVTDVVHYDLPMNSSNLEQRCGRFDRLGRIIPLTMHLLVDESRAIPLESELVEVVTASQAPQKTLGP